MARLFGTDGVRGVANTELTAQMAFQLGQAGAYVLGQAHSAPRILVGKDTRMPDYLILISTLGGLSIFGLNGFVIGPLIAALFMSRWALFVETKPRVQLP